MFLERRRKKLITTSNDSTISGRRGSRQSHAGAGSFISLLRIICGGFPFLLLFVFFQPTWWMREDVVALWGKANEGE